MAKDGRQKKAVDARLLFDPFWTTLLDSLAGSECRAIRLLSASLRTPTESVHPRNRQKDTPGEGRTATDDKRRVKRAVKWLITRHSDAPVDGDLASDFLPFIFDSLLSVVAAARHKSDRSKHKMAFD